jgi:hypothetical protein
MVLAGKLVTALQRGAASTRWRDFADLYLMTVADPSHARQVVGPIPAVAGHRGKPGHFARVQKRWCDTAATAPPVAGSGV